MLSQKAVDCHVEPGEMMTIQLSAFDKLRLTTTTISDGH